MVLWREVSKTFQVSVLSVNSSPIFFMGREGKDVVDIVIAVVFDKLVSLLVL